MDQYTVLKRDERRLEILIMQFIRVQGRHYGLVKNFNNLLSVPTKDENIVDESHIKQYKVFDFGKFCVFLRLPLKFVSCPGALLILYVFRIKRFYYSPILKKWHYSMFYNVFRHGS